MEITRSPNRIHPVMAAAAVSVIIVSLAGAAAITGLLPSSHSAPEPQLTTLPAQTPAYALTPNTLYPMPAPAAGTAQMAAPMMMPAGPVAAGYVQPAPLVAQQQPQVIKEVIIKEVEKPQPKPKVIHHYHNTQVARNDGYYQQPAPRPAQPNYVGIGTGAVIGGLLGNQVGSGNGRKLATVAGLIGGGFLGNEIANRNR
ncbi:MAG: glycine zipper 2TM domain-containing protein [Massilia sp.]